MFKPYLNLDSIYFSPLKPSKNGLFDVMTFEEVRHAITPNTESRLMNELMLVLACSNNYNSCAIAKKLGLKSSDLNACVHVLFGCSFKELITNYRKRLLFELTTRTVLTPEDVAKRTGFASAQSMYNHFNQQEHISFFELRAKHQDKSVTKVVEIKAKN